MSGRSVLLLATAGLLAAAGAFSAASGTLVTGSGSMASSANLAVDDWILSIDDSGRTVITDVMVSGVPDSVVGRTITVYLQGSSTHQAVADIPHAGSIRVPLTSPVPADGVDTVALVVTG